MLVGSVTVEEGAITVEEGAITVEEGATTVEEGVGGLSALKRKEPFIYSRCPPVETSNESLLPTRYGWIKTSAGNWLEYEHRSSPVLN